MNQDKDKWSWKYATNGVFYIACTYQVQVDLKISSTHLHPIEIMTLPLI